MNLTEILEPLGGNIAFHPEHDKKIIYNRLVKEGWQIEDNGVWLTVLKPGGGQWHVVTSSGCDCSGWYYRRWCSHYFVGEALMFQIPVWPPNGDG